jgi:serine O-acetyltransferase
MATEDGFFKVLRDDYRKHGGFRNLALFAIVTYRFGQWVDLQPYLIRVFLTRVYGLMSLWVEFATDITISKEVQTGKGLHLIHSGNIRIHPRAIIGDCVGIMHDVTIGETMGREGVPVIGNHVFIATGAKILGPVKVGDGAHIGPNSVVLSDVPAGATAMGVPARVVPAWSNNNSNQNNISNKTD